MATYEYIYPHDRGGWWNLVGENEDGLVDYECFITPKKRLMTEDGVFIGQISQDDFDALYDTYQRPQATEGTVEQRAVLVPVHTYTIGVEVNRFS